jgi:hypothetical protein
MNGLKLTLVPNEKPSVDGIPDTMVLEFDPAAKTLTATLNGEKTLFRRVN